MENNNELKNKTAAKKKIGLFLIICIVIGIFYFLYWNFYGKSHISTDDSYINGNQTTVTSQVSGPIKEIYFNDTSKVEKGQLLATIDDTNYKINLEMAEANLGKAVKDYYSLQLNIHKAQNEVNINKNNLTKITEDYHRDFAAYKKGLLSKEKYQASLNNFENSKITLALSEKNLETAIINGYSTTIYNHPIVKSAIEKYKDALLNMMRTKIYSPISGTITKKAIELGQEVSAGQNLVTVIDLNNIWVDANYKETQMKDIKIGNTVKFKSDFNDKEYSGVVVGISPGSGSSLSLLPAQNATGNWIKIVQRVPVRIAIDPQSLKNNGVVPIGTSATITADTSSKVNVETTKPSLTTVFYKIDENSFMDKVNSIIKMNSGK